MAYNSSWNGPGSIPDTCVIRAEFYQLSYFLKDVPVMRNGGEWARSLTEFDIFVMNFSKMFNYATVKEISNSKSSMGNNPNNHYQTNDIFKLNVSDLGNKGDLTVDITCTYDGTYFTVTLNRVSGNERAFKNLCGNLESAMTGKDYRNIPENNVNNNNNGYGRYGRYRGGRKTRRHRSRKSKSRRSRK